MKNYLRIALLAGVSMLSAYTLTAQAYAQAYAGDVGGSQGDVGGSQGDADDRGGFHIGRWIFRWIFGCL